MSLGGNARARFLCDAERCIECNACVTACKNENEVPWGINRRRVVTINDGSPGERSISVDASARVSLPGFMLVMKGIAKLAAPTPPRVMVASLIKSLLGVLFSDIF